MPLSHVNTWSRTSIVVPYMGECCYEAPLCNSFVYIIARNLTVNFNNLFRIDTVCNTQLNGVASLTYAISKT